MTLRFIAKDPTSNPGRCPAVFVDNTTGDLILQGWTVTDRATLGSAAADNPRADDETLIRLPARMRDVVRQAIDVADTLV